MQSPSFDIKEMLEEWIDSSGESTGTDVFDCPIHVGKEPSTPKNVITIFDTQGFPPYLSLSGESGYEYPSINIRVRNTKYDTGWNLINKIKDVLHGRHQETWNGTLYSAIICSSSPALLDWDDNGNARFIINFNLQRRTA
jgi:hypothetical protein